VRIPAADWPIENLRLKLSEIFKKPKDFLFFGIPEK
jgi:hypothetical protein